MAFTNPFRNIRKRPEMYTGSKHPSGRLLAEQVVDDKNASSFVLQQIEGWWFIASQKDWLVGLTEDRPPKTPLHPLHALFHLLSDPPGSNGVRGEVILMAFAESLVTADKEGIHWLKGGDLGGDLPQELLRRMDEFSQGRTLVFKMADNS